MDARTRGNITYAVVVGAAVLLILYSTGLFSIGAQEFAITGEVTAVENVGLGGAAGAKEALVQLESGRVVRAAIPSACIVFAGQIATLYFSGRPFSTEPSYTILSARDKK
jgi:hypothetical protein